MQRIADDERRRMRPQPPSARRVGAAWGHLQRWRSYPMLCIAFVAQPWSSPHGAPNAAHCTSSTAF